MTWNVKLKGSIFIAILFIVVSLSIITYIFGTAENYSDVFTAIQGELELTKNDLNYVIPLNGEWEFYDHVLLDPTSSNVEKSIVSVPHTWKGSNYGSYRLKITGLIPGEVYGLYALDNSSAFAIYIDDQLLGVNGSVATKKTEEVHYWNPELFSFEASKENITITVQLSNHHSYPGGLYRDIRFGRFKNLIAYRERNVIHQVLLIGGILIMSLYNFSTHILNRKEHAAMYFGLFNMIVALRIALTGERLINGWVNVSNWDYLLKLQFLTGAGMLVVFSLFMYNLFPKSINKKATISVSVFGTLIVVPIFFLPISTLSIIDSIFLVGSLSYFIYLIYTLVKSMRANEEGSIFSFIGILFITGSIVLDTLMPTNTNVIPLGVFIFIILQSLVISERYSFLVEENLKLQNIATRDGMTNLYTKEHFSKLVSENIIKTHGQDINHGMMFIDIDNFKRINDSYGHDIGDEVIKSIAEKLMKSLRYSDTACRFGGDEFVVWLPHAKADESEQIAKRILDHIAEPIKISESTIQISASIGISFYPKDGSDVDSLVSSCDTRMYRAKSDGKNRYYSHV